jgi:hypothetical protein
MLKQPQVCIFTTARPFTGHIGLIQRNALGSWTRMKPRPEVLLIGTGEGYEAAAEEAGIVHLRDVEQTEYGTPLVRAMIERAEAHSSSDILGLVAADVILFDDILEVVWEAARRFERFCVIAGRRDMTIDQPIDFGDSGWRQELVEAANSVPENSPWAGDVFFYTKGLWRGMPPFSAGRMIADNWMFKHVVRSGAELIDATNAAIAIHQNHDYPGHPKGVWESPEAKANQTLVRSWDLGSRICANWVADERGIHRPPLARNARRWLFSSRQFVKQKLGFR